MNDCCVDYPHRRYTLTQDEPNLGSMRESEAVTFSKGDQVVIELGSIPSTGKIVMIDSEGIRRLCRYEVIHGHKYLWPPPIGIDPSSYESIILGEIVEHTRLSKWLDFAE